METYLWMYIVIGFIGLTLPWLKKLEQIQLLNVPIVALSLGIVFYLVPVDLPDPDPIQYEKEILKLTEIAVLISLMGTGLRIDRDFSLKGYRVPLLLVVITMIGCIGATALLGGWLGLMPASALLLGAVFAPTDPVLAGDVQVRLEENQQQEHPVRFTLTAEAGINDGMAFPFTWLAIWVALHGSNYDEWLNTWLLKDLLYRILAGIAIGYIAGRILAWLYFELPRKLKLAPKRLGFLAVAITLFVYGITEAAQAYGFIAVFVAAISLRHYEKKHKFHKEMHDVVEQVELFLIIIILLLLGGYIAHRGLELLSWPTVGLCAIFIFIVRPLFGIVPTLGSEMPWKQRWAVAFMGIKGVGSFFYLAFAFHQTVFPQREFLWDTVAFLVLLSVVVHRIVGYYVKKHVL